MVHASPEIDRLTTLLARLPGLGPRSARRLVLHLLKHRETLLVNLVQALEQTGEAVTTCSQCGNLDVRDPCAICSDQRRDSSIICVVENVDDLWAMERSAVFSGRYHVLGGTLSALDGVGPEDLRISGLIARARSADAGEVVLATSATVAGQTTAHYLVDMLADCDVTVSRLSLGVPVGGELNFLDDGTLGAAMQARRTLTPG